MLEGARGGLTWNASFNASTNKNRMLSDQPVRRAGASSCWWAASRAAWASNIQVLQPGHAINSFFVFRHKRDASGNPLYADANGDGVINDDDLYEDLSGDGKITQDDRAPFQAPTPSWIFGHTSQFGYRGVDLGFTHAGVTWATTCTTTWPAARASTTC